MPGVLITAGLVLWIATAAVQAVSVRSGARRHRRDVARRARTAVRHAVADTALEPLRGELSAHQRARNALARAAA